MLDSWSRLESAKSHWNSCGFWFATSAAADIYEHLPVSVIKDHKWRPPCPHTWNYCSTFNPFNHSTRGILIFVGPLPEPHWLPALGPAASARFTNLVVGHSQDTSFNGIHCLFFPENNAGWCQAEKTLGQVDMVYWLQPKITCPKSFGMESKKTKHIETTCPAAILNSSCLDCAPKSLHGQHLGGSISPWKMIQPSSFLTLAMTAMTLLRTCCSEHWQWQYGMQHSKSPRTCKPVEVERTSAVWGNFLFVRKLNFAGHVGLSELVGMQRLEPLGWTKRLHHPKDCRNPWDNMRQQLLMSFHTICPRYWDTPYFLTCQTVTDSHGHTYVTLYARFLPKHGWNMTNTWLSGPNGHIKMSRSPQRLRKTWGSQGNDLIYMDNGR